MQYKYVPDCKYKSEYCQDIIEYAKTGASVAKCCALIGICKQTYYVWRNKYPDFLAADRVSRAIAQAAKEDIGDDGVSGRIDKFSSSTYNFMMRAQFRDDYASIEEKENNARTDAFKEVQELVKAAREVYTPPAKDANEANE